MVVFLVAAFVIGLAAAMLFAVQGPPYVATDDTTAAQIVTSVKACRPRRILDMGSGDGKLVMALAREGYHVDGVELNPWLVMRARRAVKKAGLQSLARIKWGNFWRYDVSPYDVITLYAIKHIMPRLEQKLGAESAPGTHIVSNYFVFPALKPIKQSSRVRVYKI